MRCKPNHTKVHTMANFNWYARHNITPISRTSSLSRLKNTSSNNKVKHLATNVG